MEKELEQFRQEVERPRAGRKAGSALAAIETPGTVTLPSSSD
ncbi:hypothetical protein [Corallococcus soli]